MKRFLFTALLLALALPAFAQTTYRPTFTATAFAKATSRSDTSTNVTVGAYPIISIHTTTTGTDSAAISVHVDGQINGLWSNDILVASPVTLGRPAGSTLAGSAHTGQVADFQMRDNGRIADLIKNCSVIRVRNVLTAGAGDSTSATTYTQNVACRKVTW